MADRYLASVEVRPIRPGERARFDEALSEHHWLGSRLVGETMRYVAVGPEGTWVALVGFGSAALSCRSREAWIGWSQDQHFRRLRYVTNNQRFCVLPEGRRPNLASAVLSKTLGRLSGDFERCWGHPVLVVETFVDPARHRGTCYAAGGFSALGQTSGYGRNGWSWHRHGKVKLAFARALRKDARRILTATFDHPALSLPPRRPMLDLNRLDFGGAGG
ncbi:MAG: Druantia anti-phage system protein DruA, partial [Acidimicrobiia bacterium]